MTYLTKRKGLNSRSFLRPRLQKNQQVWTVSHPISPREPLLRRKTAETHPPFFLEDLLSGCDNGRDRLIRA